MTDYEMADKYVTDTGNNDCTIEAYLAGLKAGKDMAEADLATIAYMQGAGAKGKRIAELENENRRLRNEVQDLTAYCNQIGKIKTEVLKLFEHITAK